MVAKKVFILLIFLAIQIPDLLQAQPEYALKGKQFTSLEKALQQPDSVVRLKLRRKGYTEFPNEIFLFKNLRELDLGNNKISKLPARLGELSQLEILNLERNKFVTITKEIGSLTQLRCLDLGMNQILALPYEMGNLSNLEMLQIWANEITALPPSMAKLSKLKWLDMRTIILTPSEREDIIDLFPDTEILMSPDCNCGR
jgi:leucine-rich repeat protein SHOC2